MGEEKTSGSRSGTGWIAFATLSVLVAWILLFFGPLGDLGLPLAAVLIAVGAVATWGYVLTRRRVRRADAGVSPSTPRWFWGMLLARLAGVALAGIAFFLEKPTLAAWGLGLVGGSLVLGMLVDLSRERSAWGRLQGILLITSATAFFAGVLAKVTWLLWIGVVGIGIGLLFALLTLLVESRGQRA
jgi:hypothetical protein